MKVRVDGKQGEFVGIVYDEREVPLAAIRLEGHGMILKLYHPSKVVPIEGEDK